MNRKSLYRAALPGEVPQVERRSADRIASMNAPKVKTTKPPKFAKRKEKR